jgi:glycosyltransferase involved in cell wall biosynthesis
MTSTPYRVLHLVHSQQRRGAEVFAAQLAACMEERGYFENGLCSLYREDDNLHINGLPVFTLDGRSSAFSKAPLNPQLVSRLCRTLRKFKPHVLVAHGSDTLKYAGATSFFNRKVRTVYRNIGIAGDWASSVSKVRLNRLFLSQMDAVVSVSEYTRRDFISVYHIPEERITYIPNGVDTSQFCTGERLSIRPRVRQELGIGLEDLVLISVGNLSDEKGHRGLLPMMRDLNNAELADHLLLLGDGPLRQELESQAQELGIGHRVHFLGRRADVGRMLAAADVFVLPSKSEGMPAVLIEAGLSGLPSVAFNVGGVGEVIEEQVTGMLVAPEDYQQMRKRLAALGQDARLRAEIGEAARRRCLDLFSMEKVASDYEALFLKMLHDSTGEKDERP